MRSRTSNLPRAVWRVRDSSGPPSRTRSIVSRSCRTPASITSRLRRNSSLAVFTRDSMRSMVPLMPCRRGCARFYACLSLSLRMSGANRPRCAMRTRDLRALEFDKVLGLVTALAVSEPGRRRVQALAPSTDADEVRRRLTATSDLVELRTHAGSLPMGEFKDQNPLFVVAAMEGATLDGKSLLDVRQFVLAARHLEAFLRSRCERFAAVAELARSLLAPKELADALLKALADDGGLLDDASRELKRLRTRLRDERAELETRLGRMLDHTGMQPFLTDHLVTIRNRRFVLPMKPNYAERLEGIVQDRSVSGETLFVEPLWAVDLNNRLMMLEREVEAEERRILAHLTRMIRGYGTELRMTFEAMVELDALNARA